MLFVYKLTLLSVVAGFCIDCIIGDPLWLPHPVMLIGRLITVSERILRRLFPKTSVGERCAGCVMAALVPLLTVSVTLILLILCYSVNMWLYFAVSSIMCWQIFAAKCLKVEAEKVVHAFRNGGLDAARRQVGMLVGRDTENLTEEQVIKAAVETVAENTTDGVISPLLWMMLFGAAGGFFYKAINTMDSMVGYKNEKYMYFGTAAAKLDDIANLIPARVSALCMILSAYILGLNGKNAARIWLRDRYNHASPNSAQTESVCAGALGVQLGGNASYFGVMHEKPTIGDKLRPIERQDVKRSCALMYCTAVITLVVCMASAAAILYIGGLFA